MLCLKLFLLLSGTAIAYSRHLHFYRKDYTYFEEFDAYYKIHWDKDGLTYDTAFMKCYDEGAKIFYPKEDQEWTVVKNLTASLHQTPNTTDIIVGMHDDTGFGEFITVDGHSTPTPLNEEQEIGEGHDCVLMDIETGTLRTDICAKNPMTVRPYVCKQVDQKPCPTIDLGYIFKTETKKCYKVNERERTWDEAMYTCLMEGGKLLVVEDDNESKMIHNMINDNSIYFVGFRRTFYRNDYYTENGQKLGEGAFQRWYDSDEDKRHNCGVVYKYSNNLYTKSKNCDEFAPFVCEMAAKRF